MLHAIWKELSIQFLAKFELFVVSAVTGARSSSSGAGGKLVKCFPNLHANFTRLTIEELAGSPFLQKAVSELAENSASRPASTVQMPRISEEVAAQRAAPHAIPEAAGKDKAVVGEVDIPETAAAKTDVPLPTTDVVSTPTEQQSSQETARPEAAQVETEAIPMETDAPVEGETIVQEIAKSPSPADDEVAKALDAAGRTAEEVAADAFIISPPHESTATEVSSDQIPPSAAQEVEMTKEADMPSEHVEKKEEADQ